MNLRERELLIRDGEYFIDGKRAADFEEGTFSNRGSLYVVVPNFGVAFDSKFDALFSLNRGPVTFIPQNQKYSPRSFIPSTSNGLYSWFAMTLGRGISPVVSPPAAFPIEITESNQINERRRRKLEQRWRESYIDSVLKVFSETVRTQQLENFRKQIHAERDENARHILFLVGGELCGHLFLKTLFFEPAGAETISVHFWVNPNLPVEVRRGIHTILWEKIAKAPWPYERYCGVAQANVRSIGYLLKNGAKPLHLRVRKT